MMISTKFLRRTPYILTSMVLLLSVMSLAIPRQVQAATVFTVNTEQDGSDAVPGDGVCETAIAAECTLRAAIQEANANGNVSEVDTVAFAIPGAGVHELKPNQGALDIISEPLRIDGSTQGPVDCLNHKLLIELNGDYFPVASRNIYFVGASKGSSVHAIASTGARPGPGGVAGAGLKTTVEDTTFTCNNVGVKADGVTPAANALGIVTVGPNTTIGGPNAQDGNLIANNSQIAIHHYHDTLIYPTTIPTGLVVQNNVINHAQGLAVAVANADQYAIRNNTLINNGESGLNLTNSKDVTVVENTISGNGTYAMGLYDVTRADVSSNTVSGHNTGISVGTSSDTTIKSNKVKGNGNSISLSGLTSVKVQNNTVGQSTGPALTIYQSTGAQVTGNNIGVDTDGITPLPNSSIGVLMVGDLGGSVLGGLNASDKNIITNNLHGVVASDVAKLRIIGNNIGVDATGQVNPTTGGNTIAGVVLTGNSQGIMIGGPENGAGNIISGNSSGIYVMSQTGAAKLAQSNSIMRNSIYGNNKGQGSGQAIDLLDDANADNIPETQMGPTANDNGDVDSGTNFYLNTPVLSKVKSKNDDVTLTYSLDVNKNEDAATSYRVEFYASVGVDSNGKGEGQKYIGSEVVSGSVKNRNITLSNTGLSSGSYYFSTTTTVIKNSATGFGSTSEFSDAMTETIKNSNPSPSTGGLLTTIYNVVQSIVGYLFNLWR